ncbi:unnamed protein product [Microthlaspi erraticum]|uniref:Uncharacterized protein n=2 Tax=Microthlaspi erraticum TaxID=1685480 RepID=A0A6D2JNV2_9BRAS|nr:unnamed protein product [Microthlaspi erraticum]
MTMRTNMSETVSIQGRNIKWTNLGTGRGALTVFINGVPTEVTRGGIDTKAMFGEDLVLVHSSGVPLPTDEFGYLMHSLQHGEAYFLVPRQA